MKQLLADIQSGAFAEEWIEENRQGRPQVQPDAAADVEHPIEIVGRKLRRMMPFVNPKEVTARTGRGVTEEQRPDGRLPYRIFDTTLRDGEQAPGCTMTRDEKLEVAAQLARLGVDIIEAGFPAASPGDWEAVHADRRRRSARPTGRSSAAWRGPTRTTSTGAGRRSQPAAHKRIHTFLATSDIHMEHKLRMSRGQVLERSATMVAYARIAVRGRGVLAGGRGPLRPGVPLRGAGRRRGEAGRPR